jgi:uncharacterized protein
MVRIILDTNFLLLPGLFKVDVFEELERILESRGTLYIYAGTIDELQTIIIKEKPKFKKAAIIALELIKRKNLKILAHSQKGSVDDIIISSAEASDIIATQDNGLKKRAKVKGLRCITLKNKKYLDYG